LALRAMAGGARRSEGSPLMGGTKRQASFLTMASFSFLVAAVLVLAWNTHGPVEMMQKVSKQQMLAKALLHKGLDLENAGKEDVQMAKLLLSMHGAHGIMLAGNDTNATEPEPAKEKSLEDRGVNVHSWPHEHEVKFLPNYKEKKDKPEFIEREVTHNHNWYNYEPLKRAGVHTGKWFWEDEDEMGPPEPVPAPADENATAAGGNSTDAEEEEGEETPEDRLRKAGIKVGGWPWDGEEEEDEEEEKEEPAEPAEPAEEEPAEEEPAAAKARRVTNLYQRGRAAYKQYQMEMAHRLMHGQRKVK